MTATTVGEQLQRIDEHADALASELKRGAREVAERRDPATLQRACERVAQVLQAISVLQAGIELSDAQAAPAQPEPRTPRAH